MKKTDLKETAREELLKKTISLREILAKTKLEMKTGKIKNMRVVKTLRRELAQVLTRLNFKTEGENS